LLGKSSFTTLGAATMNDLARFQRSRTSSAFSSALDALNSAGLFAPDLEGDDILPGRRDALPGSEWNWELVARAVGTSLRIS
jgi:hypothetical protein